MPRSNKLLILLVVTVLVVAAAVIVTYRSSPSAMREKDYVFPGLVEKINDVAKIEVRSGDGGLTVKRHEDQWVIEQADNYPASFSKIRQVAVAVADLKILAVKTSNPSMYEKLGVEDPDGEKAKSKRLTLADSANAEIASLIVGSRRTSSAPGSSRGYYVRVPAGQAQALLVEGDLDISIKPGDWFESEIINIKPEHISEVVIDHPDQQQVRLSRNTGKDDFVLSGIPEGKEVQSSYTLNNIDSVLEGIRVDDVRSADKFNFPDQVTVATVRTFDGMTAAVSSAVVDGANWSRFSFDFQAPPAPAEQTPAPAAEETGKDTRPETPPKEKPDQIDQKLVDQLTQKTAGWMYKIPGYKFDLFTRKLDDLIKDKEPEQKDKKETDKKAAKPDA